MKELFHRWFYNPEKRGQYDRVSYSFQGNFFYSYYTAIGIKVTGRDKNPVLLVADDNMSPTTGRHIRQLVAACPYGAERVIEVPLVYGDHWPTIEEITARFSTFFLKYDCARLSRADNRRDVRARAAAARQFSALVRKLPKKVMAAIDALDRDAAAIDDKKAGARKAVLARSKAAAEKERRAYLAFLKAIQKMPYLDQVKAAFTRKSTLTPEQRSTVRHILLASYPRASFVWPDGDIIRTSQGVTLPAALIASLIKRWMAGALPVGSHIGPYTLQAYDSQHVRIGCHSIPLENIRALAAELLPSE